MEMMKTEKAGSWKFTTVKSVERLSLGDWETALAGGQF